MDHKSIGIIISGSGRVERWPELQIFVIYMGSLVVTKISLKQQYVSEA